jgi:DNA-binding CsgD family transcriptional regulator
MARVREADLGRITRFLASLRSTGAAQPVSHGSLASLRDLVGADDAEYFELRRADRGLVAHVQTADVEPDAGSDEALRRYGAQNPLNWRRWRPEDGPMRLSGRIGRRALEALEFYHGFLRPNGLTDNLKVWLHADATSAACIQLWRLGGTFSQRDEDVLGVLQQHLISLRSAAVARRQVFGAGDVSLTRREAEIITWAVRGESDVAIAARFAMSPATVGKHLENAFAALGVHSRAEAMWRLSSAAPTPTEVGGLASRQGGSLER